MVFATRLQVMIMNMRQPHSIPPAEISSETILWVIISSDRFSFPVEIRYVIDITQKEKTRAILSIRKVVKVIKIRDAKFSNMLKEMRILLCLIGKAIKKKIAILANQPNRPTSEKKDKK
jgi:hypothetical protein